MTWYSISGIKKNQHAQAEQLKRILFETSDPRVIISERLKDHQNLISSIDKKLNGYLNSQQNWIDYSFRKPESYQTVSLLLEEDVIVSQAAYDPINRTFNSGGLNISPLKVKQWKKIFS